MNKAVMISIQPKWCELIATGKKTIEVRKTKPKIDTPFKCYIYCSQNQFMARKTNGDFWFAKRNSLIQPIDSIQFSGTVIGEFVCDYIEDIACEDLGYEHIYYTENGDCINEKTQLTNEELKRYLGVCSNGNILGYAWNISKLKIYDKPKELGEFCIMKKCNACKSGYESNACIYDNNCKVPVPLTRPPQSWCYVEEFEE